LWDFIILIYKNKRKKMSAKIDKNFENFLSKDINLSSYVLTESLEKISRFNIFSRISNAKKLNSTSIVNYIEKRLIECNKGLQLQTKEAIKEKTQAITNLTEMRAKFSKNKQKGADLGKRIDSIIEKLQNLNSNAPTTNVSEIPKSEATAAFTPPEAPTNEAIAAPTAVTEVPLESIEVPTKQTTSATLIVQPQKENDVLTKNQVEALYRRLGKNFQQGTLHKVLRLHFEFDPDPKNNPAKEVKEYTQEQIRTKKLEIEDIINNPDEEIQGYRQHSNIDAACEDSKTLRTVFCGARQQSAL
jgi:hypothetical protein